MKKLVILLAIALMLTAVPAWADIVKGTIESATLTMDKNGNPYVRFIVPIEREEGGVKYSMGIPVLAFGKLVEEAKTYKAGDAIDVRASYRKLADGRESYTIHKFVKAQ